MMASSVGTVVVGIGRAGGVRIRDLQLSQQYKDVSNLHLAGYVSRRELTLPGVEPMTLDQALQSDKVHAIIVCTENKSHEDIARKALDAGKHVLVDFPLALKPAAAKHLFQLADKKGLACHEEDIGMMVESHKILKDRMDEKADLMEAHFALKGRFNGWIENTEESGSAFVSSINLLHAMLDICGDLTVVECAIKMTPEVGSDAIGKLITMEGKPVTISISRHKDGVPRQQTFSFKFGDGTVIDSDSVPRPTGPPTQQTPDKPGLFMRDLAVFANLVSHKQQSLPQTAAEKRARWLTVRGLELAEELESFAK